MLAESPLRLPTKEEVELGIVIGKEVIVPTIKLLLKGRLRKKSVETRLLYNVVFTFYDPISIEDYNSIFAHRIKESRVDKNKLEIDGLTVNYKMSPNVKSVLPVALEAQYGNRVLKEEEMLSMITRIDQIRLFVFPTQEEMSIEDLEFFAKALDNFIERIELFLRREKKLQLNMIVKHLILESNNAEFLENASNTISDEGIRIYRSNDKVTVAYLRLGDLLRFIKNLW